MSEFHDYLFKHGCLERDESFDILSYFKNNKLSHSSFYKRNALVYQSLVEQLQSNNLVPFWGAGFTAPSYPLWGKLLEDFAKKRNICIDNSLNAEDLASSLIKEGGAQNFGAYLENVFREPARLSSSRTRIRAIFRNYHITTNYDSTIESLEASSPMIVYLPHENVSKSTQNNESCIIKLHGDISNKDEMVLTKESYDTNYPSTGQSELQKVLFNLLSSKNVIFMGCSLEEDRTMQIIDHCARKGCRFFALLPLPPCTENVSSHYEPNLEYEKLQEVESRETKLLDRNIIPLWYPYNKHECMDELLDLLHDIVVHPKIKSNSQRIQAIKNFVGREDEMGEIIRKFKEEQIPYISGIPGIGKTQICHQVIQNLYDRNLIQNHLIIDCQNIYSLDMLRSACEQLCGMQNNTLSKYSIEAQAETLRNSLLQNSHKGDLLFFFDNFDIINSNAVDKDFFGDLLLWLDALSRVGVKLLIASRYDELMGTETIRDDSLIDNYSPVRLPVFTNEQSRIFFQAQLSQWTCEGESFENVLSLVAGHPLAIKIVIGLTKRCTNWENVLARLRESKAETILTRSCRAVWSILSENKEAYLIWGIISWSVVPIPKSWLSKFNGQVDIWDGALALMKSLSLIDINDDFVTMLIPIKEQFEYLAAQDSHLKGESRSWWIDRIATLLLIQCSEDIKYSHQQILHILGSLIDDKIESEPLVIRQFSEKMKDYYSNNYSESKHYLKKLLKYSSNDRELKAFTLRELGECNMFFSDYIAAEKNYTESAKLYKELNSKMGQANVLKSRGEMYKLQGRYVCAYRVLRQAQVLYEAEGCVLGVANVLLGLSAIFRMRYRYDEAIQICNIVEQQFKAINEIRGLGNVYQEIGDLYRLQDAFQEALTSYDKAESEYKKVSSEQCIANLHFCRGEVHRVQGHDKVAITHYINAKKRFDNAGDSLSSANTLHRLGEIYRVQKDLRRAEECYSDAERIFRKIGDIVGIAHVSSSKGDLLASLALFIEENDTNEKSFEIFETALKMYNQAEVLYRESEDYLGLGELLWSSSVVLSELKRLDLALSKLGEAEEIFISIQAKKELIDVYKMKIFILEEMGNITEKNRIQEKLDKLQ